MGNISYISTFNFPIVSAKGMSIGYKIKKVRELKDFTQDEMAVQLKMSQANYSKIERNEVDINFNRLKEIADILKIDVNDLMNFDEKNFFLIQHNDNITGINGTVNNHYEGGTLADKERENYEFIIRLLNEKIALLEEKLKMLGDRKGVVYPSINDPIPGDKGPQRKSKS